MSKMSILWELVSQQHLRYCPTLGVISCSINADEKCVGASWLLDLFPVPSIHRGLQIVTLYVSLSPNNKTLLYSILVYYGTLSYANKMEPLLSKSMSLLGPAQAPMAFFYPMQLNYPCGQLQQGLAQRDNSGKLTSSCQPVPHGLITSTSAHGPLPVPAWLGLACYCHPVLSIADPPWLLSLRQGLL